MRVATVTLAAVGALIVAAGVAAADPPAAPPPTYDLPTVIDNLRFWVAGISGAVGTLFLTIGGARMMMAGGDPAEVERAKASLKSAAHGYALALLAPVLMTILTSMLRA
jgi:hypothetical protein